MLFDVAANINTAQCIGCARCIKVCPVDAIIGAPKKLHQILPNYCTGCEDCVSVCPVDCIDLIPTSYSSKEREIRESISDRRTEVQLAKKAQKTKTAPAQTMRDNSIADDLAAILARAQQKRAEKKIDSRSL